MTTVKHNLTGLMTPRALVYNETSCLWECVLERNDYVDQIWLDDEMDISCRLACCKVRVVGVKAGRATDTFWLLEIPVGDWIIDGF